MRYSCELCHLIAECKHTNFVSNYQPGYITQIGHKALTEGGEHHHEDALRAVHLEVLDGDAITLGLVRVGPRAPVTGLLRDLYRPSILVY